MTTSFSIRTLIAVVYIVAGVSTLILGGEERLYYDENLPNDEFLCKFK